MRDCFTKPIKQIILTINISDDKSAIGISFDYLDYLEGGVIQLYHTGTSSRDVVLTGTVQGGGIFQRNKIPEIIQHLIILSGRTIKIVAFTLLFLFMPFITLIAWLTDPKVTIKSIEFWGLIVTTMLFWGLGYYTFRRRVPKFFDILTLEAG